MNAIPKPVPVKAPKATQFGKNASDDIRARASKELVLGLSGPVGSGIPFVRDALLAELRSRNYQVVHIKVSDLLASEAERHSICPSGPPEGSLEFKRISRLQDVGNGLRRTLGEDIGAQLAMRAISQDRVERHTDTEDIEKINPGRVAYVIDQLKHPREAQLLRDVYGNLFYLVGVLCGYEHRKSNLKSKMSADFAERLIQRDKAESDKDGQQLDKTLKLADFFIRNSHHNTEMLKTQVKRLLGLVHGENGLTPTRKEKGMYAAYSAALQSACLSRQVGAAIVDGDGNIISTGCNDVPRAGGGLYEAGISPDHRCVFREGGICFNDQRKDKIRDEVEEILASAGASAPDAKKYANAIRSNTSIRDLIEFSRAVHAEMDAIVKVARKGGPSIVGSFLFTTTYPCHNCARHIVAAGIRAVYFIEPYEKSLASSLHNDSIEHEPESEPNWDRSESFERVAFLHFEGVSPMRFASLFLATEDRKDKRGKAIERMPIDADKKSPEFLDNYKQLEAKIVRRLEGIAVAGEQPELEAIGEDAVGKEPGSGSVTS